MLSRLQDLPTDQGFAPGSKLFVFQEVIDQGGEPIKVQDYYETGNFIILSHCIIVYLFLHLQL